MDRVKGDDFLRGLGFQRLDNLNVKPGSRADWTVTVGVASLWIPERFLLLLQ